MGRLLQLYAASISVDIKPPSSTDSWLDSTCNFDCGCDCDVIETSVQSRYVCCWASRAFAPDQYHPESQGLSRLANRV